MPRARIRVPMLALSLLVTGCGPAATPRPTAPPGETIAPRTAGDPARPECRIDTSYSDQAAATLSFRLGAPAAIEFVPSGDAILFLRSGPRDPVRNLYEVDLRTGEERVLLTAERILGGEEEELSPEQRARRERLRLSARGITSFETSRDGRTLLVPLSGRLFLFDRTTAQVRELPTGEGYADDPVLSPDASKVAFVREGDLYVLDIASGRERRLTRTARAQLTNGLAEFVAQEEMGRYRGFWWSPDGTTILYQETDTSRVETLYASDPLHPEQAPSAAPFPRAGRDNARVRLGLVRASGGATRWVTWDAEALPYLASVVWTEGAPPTIVVEDRSQREARILAIDPASGRTRTLHVERDPAWINLDQDVPRWIARGREFLWTTERGGEWQLEVRTASGDHARTLTPAGFGYRGLAHVDERRGVVWVRASREPTEQHLFRVKLDGTGQPEQVTAGRGVHDAIVAGDGELWVHDSRLLHPSDDHARHVLRRGDAVVATLRSEAERPSVVPNVELTTAGARDLRAAIVRPRGHRPEQRLPVIVSVYGGPHVQVVRAVRDDYLDSQWIADHGFIVVSIDGRGTPSRGRAFERAIRGNFVDVPLADQVEGLRALAQRHPEMDLEHVGIFGWSFGGYMAAMAVLRRPDVFDVAVAGAPVTDWTDYDTHYTERYLGLPEENAEGYRASSALTFASELARPLLVVHGTADDNVYFTHAIKLSDALLRAGRDHDFLPLSGGTHVVRDPAVARALDARVLAFLAAGVGVDCR